MGRSKMDLWRRNVSAWTQKKTIRQAMETETDGEKSGAGLKKCLTR
jgi:hypothetical protein